MERTRLLTSEVVARGAVSREALRLWERTGIRVAFGGRLSALHVIRFVAEASRRVGLPPSLRYHQR